MGVTNNIWGGVADTLGAWLMTQRGGANARGVAYSQWAWLIYGGVAKSKGAWLMTQMGGANGR